MKASFGIFIVMELYCDGRQYGVFGEFLVFRAVYYPQKERHICLTDIILVTS